MYRKCKDFSEYVKQNVGCTPVMLSTCSEPMFTADGTPLTEYAFV